MEYKKRLIVITGPTASGKSGLAVEVAKYFSTEIISADSRQIYRGIPIGTAAPTAEQLAEVPHHFVGCLELDDYYSAARFESDVMELLPKLWQRHDTVVMCGGSMMYVDAVTRGIDDLPEISPEIRRQTADIYERGGIQALRVALLERDPVYYREVDLNNPRRMIHAIEICDQSGARYSSLRTGTRKARDFEIIMFAIGYDREKLFGRINRRVDMMMTAGLEDEARRVWPLRHLNSLNTVGYKEMFAWFAGEMSRETAVARIAKNTRVYAKKQMLWMRSRPEITVLEPSASLQQLLRNIPTV